VFELDRRLSRSIRTFGIVRPQQLVERLVAVINTSALEALEELYSPSYLDHDPLPGQPAGLDGVRSGLAMLVSPEVTPRFHLEDCFAVGDRVAYRIFGSWEAAPEFVFEAGLGSRPTLQLSGVGIFRCTQDRLAERWGRWEFTSNQ
jgi:hypothetical protein